MYDKTGLNLTFEEAFALVLENILDPSAVIHFNRNSTTISVTHHCVRMAEWSGAYCIWMACDCVGTWLESQNDHLIFF